MPPSPKHTPASITIRRPDDWHVHLRDGPMLNACAVHTARQFARAIIMPNLVPPVTKVAEAASYRDRIRRAVPAEHKFEPLMKDAKLGDDADKVAVHGMQVDKFSGYGTRDEKPVKFTAVLICKDNTSTLAVIALGDETAFKRHLRDIDATLDSIRPK